jgi:putative acetyltransferase
MTMQKPRSLPASPLLIRPRGAPLVFPYQNYIVRSWRLDDRSGAAEVIRKSLEQYGLSWEPEGADADAILVDEHYIGNAEFWVVCDEQDEAKIYGTAAFRPWERSPEDTAELRKLYLSSDVRNVGLGSFLCDACEERARQLGFKYAVIETASQLSEAVRLYVHKNYSHIAELDTERCDIAMRKTLLASSEDRIGPERVKVVDRRGCFVATAPRDKTRRYRMLYGAIVVLILSQDGERILIQRRSMQKVFCIS